MLFSLALRNILSRKSSLIIVLFIALFIAVLVTANALFDGTDRGIQEVYCNSFTGDIVIRPLASYPLSLFGDDTPVTGELSKIELLAPYSAIQDTLSADSRIRGTVSQITGMAIMEAEGARIPVFLFGVEASSYLSLMPSIILEEGAVFTEGERGLLLSRAKVREIENASGKELPLGSMIQFVVQEGPTFRIRAAPLTGIYSYAVENEMLGRIALVDPITIRSLMDLDSRVFVQDADIPEENSGLLDDAGDIDALFSSDADFIAAETAPLPTEELFPDEAASAEEETAGDSINWNFIIAKAESPKMVPHIIRDLNRIFKENGWAVDAVNWRYAAGSTALYVYWMRIIFNAGILIVLATGFIVVNNTLVISVLDRTREIGMLRAIGARRRFISLLFLTETLLLTLSAGLLGCIAGAGAACLLRAGQITLANDFLIQLFGGSRLIPVLTFPTVLRCFLLSVALGLIGWIYPVRVALTTSPVVAMRGSA